MRSRKSGAVSIFIGCLLIVVFVVGLLYQRNPGTFIRPNRYDFALEQFVAFCGEFWIPAGIIGIPLFLVSLILSLYRENKENK